MSLASSLPSSSARLSPSRNRDDQLANLDPQLHPSSGSPSNNNSNRLADFAGHILDAPDTFTRLMDEQRGGEMSPHGHDGVEHSRAMDLLSFANDDAGVGGRIGSSGQSQHGERAFGELLEAARGDGGEGGQMEGGLGQGPPPPPAGQGRKRKRQGPNGEEVEDPEDPSLIKNKKESHKEVERRRRENINEGINMISALVPLGTDKQGKGAILRSAALYMQELIHRSTDTENERNAALHELANLRTEFDNVTARLQEENTRSKRLEMNWHEADERAATAHLELENVRRELADLRARGL